MKQFKLILLLCIIPVLGFNQSTLKGKKVLHLPEKYLEPFEDVVLSESDIRQKGVPWEVYSDRIGNKTTKTPGENDNFKSLKFLEKFYVIEEYEKHVRLVKDSKIDYYGILSSEAIDYGYIKKENLLLWSHCLLTVEGKINKKAMVLNTIETFRSREANNVIKEIAPFYKNPELSIKANRESRLYEIFYIFKITDKAVLLGKKDRISAGANISELIIGWIPRNRITFWDHRIALEPNWKEKAAKERKNEKKKTTVLADVVMAKKFGNGEKVRSRAILWDNDTYTKRSIGDWKRFPILDMYEKDNYYLIGLMGELRSDNGELSQMQQATVNRSNQTLRSSKRNINLIFVIDGSASMSPYFGSVSKAIERSMQKMVASKKHIYNNIEFGAVVYRDFLDGEKMYELQPLTKRYKDITLWLNNRVAGNWGDKDMPEAVYFGIKKALKSVGLPKNETNVIVLVGDAGNHHREDETQVNKDYLINLLSQYGCHFMAFQVNNDDKYDTYDEFKIQIKDLILETALNLTKNDKSKKTSKLFNYSDKPAFIKAGYNCDTLNSAPILAMLSYPDKGKKLKSEELEQEISKFINYVDAYVNDFILLIDKVFEGGSVEEVFSENVITKNTNKNASAFKSTFIYYLSSLGISDDQIEIMCEENVQLYTEAYTPINVKGLKEPPFQRVLFLNKLELGNLIRILNKLSTAKSSGDRRKKLVKTWIEILQSHIGGISEEEIKEMDLEEINNKIFGLPGTSKLLKDTKLKHLEDPSVVNENQIGRYIMSIDIKFSKLSGIFNAPFDTYSFRSNDETYYWIPEFDIP
ncbi:MAG: VWA domain-containing protein [Bacteroidales bacterium]|nr:VWA domain-containing protein [Bacteroidales bacterium]